MTITHQTDPRVSQLASATAVHRLADAELALPPRLGYVALLLAALTMTGVVAALWLTEPALPARAKIAFAFMIPIGLSWAAFALWVLTHRRVLFARHSIVAGRMAVTFTSLFVIGALAVRYTAGGTAPYAAALVGMVMLAAAVVVLRRAHRTFARLSERRLTLARELGRSATSPQE